MLLIGTLVRIIIMNTLSKKGGRLFDEISPAGTGYLPGRRAAIGKVDVSQINLRQQTRVQSLF